MVSVDRRQLRRKCATPPLGMDRIITDHHSVDSTSSAIPVVIPTDGLFISFPGSVRAGVAYKLAEAVSLSVGGSSSNCLTWRPGYHSGYGPIGQREPASGPAGLDKLNTAPRLTSRADALRPLARNDRRRGGQLFPRSRLNSAGRLDHAMVSYRLLTTDRCRGPGDRRRSGGATATAKLTQLGLEEARERPWLRWGYPLIMVGA